MLVKRSREAALRRAWACMLIMQRSGTVQQQQAPPFLRSPQFALHQGMASHSSVATGTHHNPTLFFCPEGVRNPLRDVKGQGQMTREYLRGRGEKKPGGFQRRHSEAGELRPRPAGRGRPQKRSVTRPYLNARHQGHVHTLAEHGSDHKLTRPPRENVAEPGTASQLEPLQHPWSNTSTTSSFPYSLSKQSRLRDRWAEGELGSGSDSDTGSRLQHQCPS